MLFDRHLKDQFDYTQDELHLERWYLTAFLGFASFFSAIFLYVVVGFLSFLG